ncbi:MAG: type I-F CRISPR-associated protein Csy3 [Moraxellaceae bacterium]|nr:MAG: type I-F CRISPR-associated protein Csy3 [Moraxellaceae bacterium]
MTQIFKKLPGSLSLQRGSIISDGAFYHYFAENKAIEPLYVLHHGIRGTQNVAGNKAKGAALGNSAAREVSNIQQTESAKLAPDAKLLVKFNLRFIDLEHILFACATGKNSEVDVSAFRAAFNDFIARAKNSDGLKEVARRYTRNIVNGRWLWRNRIIAESITIRVYEDNGANKAEQPVHEFDALSVPFNHFDHYSEQENNLANVVLAGMQGDRSASLNVEAIIDFGMGGIEVFPSQNYLEDKPKGFSRSLYKISNEKLERQTTNNQFLGQAALRDQKIGNAIRTIDTWYPDYGTIQKIIPVEPNGANLDAQEFFRIKDKASAFDIMKKIAELDPTSDDGMFLLACIIRGGVYSEGE